MNLDKVMGLSALVFSGAKMTSAEGNPVEALCEFQSPCKGLRFLPEDTKGRLSSFHLGFEWSA